MLKDIISVLSGLIGIALLSHGAYLITPALGFITLGAALTIFSFLMSRANAIQSLNKKKP